MQKALKCSPTNTCMAQGVWLFYTTASHFLQHYERKNPNFCQDFVLELTKRAALRSVKIVADTIMQDEEGVLLGAMCHLIRRAKLLQDQEIAQSAQPYQLQGISFRVCLSRLRPVKRKQCMSAGCLYKLNEHPQLFIDFIMA